MNKGEAHILSEDGGVPLKVLKRLLWRTTSTASEVTARTKKMPKNALSTHVRAKLTLTTEGMVVKSSGLGLHPLPELMELICDLRNSVPP
ncbi:hypothetical protein TRAPUB_10193 [Trametes pubescens]|uniref:Uncharacterized protein n=1 Tax=Trametes pubescens TaxID=154538 RepID=A0A1M2W082_TRAPU|nr:hypothetical protein TRAPUB_10193 [Trametes pubescens]